MARGDLFVGRVFFNAADLVNAMLGD